MVTPLVEWSLFPSLDLAGCVKRSDLATPFAIAWMNTPRDDNCSDRVGVHSVMIPPHTSFVSAKSKSKHEGETGTQRISLSAWCTIRNIRDLGLVSLEKYGAAKAKDDVVLFARSFVLPVFLLLVA